MDASGSMSAALEEPVPWRNDDYAARLTDRVKEDLLRALREAREFLSSVDRSVLGTLALDGEVLAVIYAELFDTKYDRAIVVDWQYSFMGALIFYTYELMTLYPTLSPLWIEAEVWLWNCVGNGIDFDSVMTRNLMNEQTMERFSALRRVYENPTHLSFYEAGIWDEDLIRACLANDIDASMAVGL